MPRPSKGVGGQVQQGREGEEWRVTGSYGEVCSAGGTRSRVVHATKHRHGRTDESSLPVFNHYDDAGAIAAGIVATLFCYRCRLRFPTPS